MTSTVDKACTLAEQAIIVDRAAMSADPTVLSSNEMPSGQQVSETCRGTLLEVGITESTIRIARHLNPEAFGPSKGVDSFMAFVTVDALAKTERSFPISDFKDLQDPKTKGTPAIGVPNGTKLEKVVDLNALKPEDAARIGKGERPAQVTFKNGRSVKLIYIPASTDKDGYTHIDVRKIPDQNFLIYLPKKYFVATPSSIHREAYPHDNSYVLSALIRHAKKVKETDSKLAKKYLVMARDMLKDFAYETKEFGYPTNGNRGYYLTRSQTNNLAANVWEYFQATGDKKWLKEIGLPMAKAIDRYWTGHKDGRVEATVDGKKKVGYRWISHGVGPCKEVWESHGVHKAYYFRALDDIVELKDKKDADRPSYARGFDYSRVVTKIDAQTIATFVADGKIRAVNVDGAKGMENRMFVLDGSATKSGKDEPVIKVGNYFYTFTPEFYRSDRSQRVSGFDSNHMFGPYNAFTSDFMAAAHNIQLFRQAADISKMHSTLGDKKQAAVWRKAAAKRKGTVLTTMWNKKEGMIFDYDTVQKRQRTEYPFAASAYAIWAGLFDASDKGDRAKLMQMVSFLENRMEGGNGIYASGVNTGLHWDRPRVWPIHNGMIVAGLREYAASMEGVGAKAEAAKLVETADRIAIKYLKANYRDWKRSRGTEIMENVGPDKGVYTGYEMQANYIWNLAASWDLYDGLTEGAKKSFHAYVKLKGWN